MAGCLNISAERVGNPIAFETKRLDDPLVVEVTRLGSPLSISCSLVCSVSEEFYLRVSPDAVIWLDPNSADIFVESNVQWRIE